MLTKVWFSDIIICVAGDSRRQWEHSSAGRASALQAEGHRFEPYCSHQKGDRNPIPYKYGLVAQLVRALACHARGRGFEPHPGRHIFFSRFCSDYASVAQLVEQRTENPRVVGSIPTGGTILADLAHLVERDLAKVEVAGSRPVIRSINKTRNKSLSLVFIYGDIAKW